MLIKGDEAIIRGCLYTCIINGEMRLLLESNARLLCILYIMVIRGCFIHAG